MLFIANSFFFELQERLHFFLKLPKSIIKIYLLTLSFFYQRQNSGQYLPYHLKLEGFVRTGRKVRRNSNLTVLSSITLIGSLAPNVRSRNFIREHFGPIYWRLFLQFSISHDISNIVATKRENYIIDRYIFKKEKRITYILPNN